MKQTSTFIPDWICRFKHGYGIRLFLTLLAFFLGSLCGCRPTVRHDETIRVWAHQGQEAENQALREMVRAFNAAHQEEPLQVEIDFFPDFQYTEKVSIAAAARDLPDAMELDGPSVAQFVDAGLMQPLDDWFDEETLADFLPTIRAQGTIDGTLYTLGAFDSAMALYYDRIRLAKAGIQPPSPGTAWTWNEFMAACRALKAAGQDPVALHMDISADEWYTYAFSPVVWSAGGRLIAEDGVQVEGVLDAPGNVAGLSRWQAVFSEDLADRNPVDPDPFGSGKTAMDWTGHWMAQSHRANKGEALGVMPLPTLGDSPVAPCGSWCWGITAQAHDTEAAAKWIAWVTDAETGVVPMTRANGAVPARRSSFELAPEFQQPPYGLFRELLESSGRPRPRTPHYAPLTQHFAAALRDIANGAPVEQRLNRSAAQIQRIIDRRTGARVQ